MSFKVDERKMAFKSKIKWVALFVLALSMGSLVVHLSMTKFSAMGLVQYSPMTALRHDFGLLGTQVNLRFYLSVYTSMLNIYVALCTRLHAWCIYGAVYNLIAIVYFMLQGSRNKKLWGAVKSLESLQPYANPRTNYPGNEFSLNCHLFLHLMSFFINIFFFSFVVI